MTSFCSIAETSAFREILFFFTFIDSYQLDNYTIINVQQECSAKNEIQIIKMFTNTFLN